MLSVWQATRLLKYVTRFTTGVRLYFTIFWSSVSALAFAFGFAASAFDELLLKHLLTISVGLSLFGWTMVVQAVLEGLQLVELERDQK
jgi:hypothetical protein